MSQVVAVSRVGDEPHHLYRKLRGWIWTLRHNSPVTWTFRNRIELRPGSRLQHGEPEWIIEDSGSGNQIKLVGLPPPKNIPVVQALQEGIEDTLANSPAIPIKDAQRLVLTGIGYNSEAEAVAEGELWRGRGVGAFAAVNISGDFGRESQPEGRIHAPWARRHRPWQKSSKRSVESLGLRGDQREASLCGNQSCIRLLDYEPT